MRNSNRKRSAPSGENLAHRRNVDSCARWLNQAWPAGPAFSNSALLMGALRATPTYTSKDFFCAGMLPVKLTISNIYTIKQSNKIPTSRKNQNKTIYLTISKTEFEENICLRLTWPDGLLIEYGD